ncbi:MAG: hypothetical protein ABIK45_13080 [Pseudomonadota bacterium]
MSIINPIDPTGGYAPLAAEERKAMLSPALRKPETTMPDEQTLAPLAKARAESRDQQTTVQQFQYTGKGAFIDKVF